MKLSACLLFLLVTVSTAVSAQVTVMFVPEINGTQLNGLMNLRIMNAAQRMDVRMQVMVNEARTGRVLTIETPAFALYPGNNALPATAVRTAKITMSNNRVGNYIQTNQYFPVGDFEYTFRVQASTSEQISEQTFYHELTPPAPLDLIEPYNQEQRCDKRPLFTWQPAIPQINGTLYELILVEMKEKQNPVEALNYNLPLVNQKSISTNMLMYPPVSKELQEGKKYAWQVTAYKDKTVINRSEVWEFTINCQDSIVNVPESDLGYRDIDDLAKGNYYVAQGVVKFSLMNSYTEQRLKYTISCVTDPRTKIRSLPRVNLKRGQNKINLDFSHNFSFTDGYTYILRTQLQNGTVKSLRFIYKDVR